jgi:UDP-N-acetylmuramate--alanine ligase
MAAPGMHNARNALAVIGVGLRLGMPISRVIEALAQARLPGRRLELVAEINGARVYDDYGHHPTEVATTLRAARELCRGRLICAFQPFRASRLQALLHEFASSFGDADEVILVPVAPPDDVPIPGVDHELLAREIRRVDPARPVRVLASVDDVPADVLPRLADGDVVVCMGIGDIYRAAYLMADAAGAALPAL